MIGQFRPYAYFTDKFVEEIFPAVIPGQDFDCEILPVVDSLEQIYFTHTSGTQKSLHCKLIKQNISDSPCRGTGRSTSRI